MKYNLILTINEPAAFELIEPDLQKADRARSTIRLSKKGGMAVVEIESDDAVALRASVDSIVQLLKVYEKMREIK